MQKGYRVFSSKVTFSSNSLEELASYLKEGRFRKISFMLGAGVSVKAGIPDFRSQEGIYTQAQFLDLPSPECIFDLNYFKKDPKPFYTLARQFLFTDSKPTVTHRFIRMLEQKKLLLMCYTQNVDELELKAGVSPKKVVQAHGSGTSAHCTHCGEPFDASEMRRCVKAAVPAYCHCGGVVKPDIVFFGEAIPWEYHAKSELIVHSDLLFIIGTSLLVFPFSSLAGMVEPGTPRVVLNTDDSDAYKQAGFKFNSKGPTTDLFLQGNCHTTLQKVCELAGWGEDLKAK